jgi:hypothetical protein
LSIEEGDLLTNLCSSRPGLWPNTNAGRGSLLHSHKRGNAMLLESLWLAEEDAVIVQGRKDGLSARQIALKLIGSIVPRSRNAVIGRSHRLNLPPLENCSALRARVQRKKEKPKSLPVRATAPSPPIDSSLAVSLAPTFYDPPYETCLTFDQIGTNCRYPIKDRFCPFEKTHSSYCAHHYRITHLKSSASLRPYIPGRRHAA